MSSQYGELRPTSGWDLLASLGHPCKFQRVSCLSSITAQHFSSGRQPNFAALNRGCHLYSAGQPSRWASTHILVNICFPGEPEFDSLASVLFSTSFRWEPLMISAQLQYAHAVTWPLVSKQGAQSSEPIQLKSPTCLSLSWSTASLLGEGDAGCLMLVPETHFMIRCRKSRRRLKHVSTVVVLVVWLVMLVVFYILHQTRFCCVLWVVAFYWSSPLVVVLLMRWDVIAARYSIQKYLHQYCCVIGQDWRLGGREGAVYTSQREAVWR